MKKFDYINDGVFGTFKLALKNPKLFIPHILSILVTVVLGLVFLYFNNLFPFLSLITDEAALQGALSSFLGNTPALFKLIISLVILLVINIAIGVTLIAMRYRLIRQVVKKEKFTSLFKTYKEASSYSISLVFTTLVLFFIALIPLALLLIPLAIFIPALTSGSLWPIAPLAIIVLLVLAIFVYLKLIFFYTFAALFLEKKTGPVLAIKQSIQFFKKHKKHVVYIFLTVAIVSIVVSALFSILNAVVAVASAYTALAFLAILFSILRFAVNIVLSIWQTLLIFRTY